MSYRVEVSYKGKDRFPLDSELDTRIRKIVGDQETGSDSGSGRRNIMVLVDDKAELNKLKRALRKEFGRRIKIREWKEE